MSATNRSLNALYPAFSERVRDVLAEMERWAKTHRPGCRPLVTETYRSQSRQDALYAQSRTAPGPRVTDAKVSNHTSCLACDVAKVGANGKLDYDDAEWYAYYGHVVRSKGMTWGGNFKRIPDGPHMEWPMSDGATYEKARAWRKAVGLG